MWPEQPDAFTLALLMHLSDQITLRLRVIEGTYTWPLLLSYTYTLRKELEVTSCRRGKKTITSVVFLYVYAYNLRAGTIQKTGRASAIQTIICAGKRG